MHEGCTRKKTIQNLKAKQYEDFHLIHFINNDIKINFAPRKKKNSISSNS